MQNLSEGTETVKKQIPFALPESNLFIKQKRIQFPKHGKNEFTYHRKKF